ncbi:hypothetical protein FOYG_04725 [Fusarium oxysporum NRRL 32931]|uniref:Uncharacterized protein n=1 Tax=Fusarium oxysporum NRRL 32931 TaxID=660029 RepID=W9ISR6_FUSOX|nr:hypothetical protein FOYG_04725 [Fusarium oxysporum NRRL 32931]
MELRTGYFTRGFLGFLRGLHLGLSLQRHFCIEVRCAQESGWSERRMRCLFDLQR